MKKEELMLGDWYKWSAEGKGYFYQIKPEDFTKDYVANFNPIPLTPDILGKNGFEESYDEYKFKGIEIGFETDDQFPHIAIECTMTSPNLEIIYNIGKTLYVHELQHALRLCGLNELADNFKV